MDVKKRRQNERKFPNWEDVPGGGRRYWYDVEGRSGWIARYVKYVDLDKSTVDFCQEIFDSKGTLREVHEKFPTDLGHRKVSKDEQE